MTNNSLPIIQLVGDPQENFYQLGLKDREQFLPTLKHLESLLATGFGPVDNTFKSAIELYSRKLLFTHKSLSRNISAYSDGLNYPKQKLLGALLLPEILSALNYWLPPIPSVILGCSSIFTLDENTQAPIHARILDFPLAGTYDQNQRAISYKFHNQPTIWSFSSAGFPYPSITAMNDQGLTIALHQKYNKSFHFNGHPIFELLYKLLNECYDKKSVLKFLKKHPTLTTWGLNMSFTDGTALTIDICGSEIHHKEIPLEVGKIFYLSNLPVKKGNTNQKANPIGLENYCQMREAIMAKKIKNIKKDSLTEIDLVKLLALPLDQSSEIGQDLKMDTLTPGSITIVTMNAKAAECLFVPGPSPRILREKVTKFSDVWQSPRQQSINITHKKISKDYDLGLQSLTKAQSAFDRKLNNEALHHTQMAIEYLTPYPDKFIAQFYNLVFQYRQTTRENEMAILLKEFKQLEGQLPSYINDHNSLFIHRLEKQLFNDSEIKKSRIKNAGLRKVWEFDNSLRPSSLKALRHLVIPRIEIQDVVYGYFKLK